MRTESNVAHRQADDYEGAAAGGSVFLMMEAGIELAKTAEFMQYTAVQEARKAGLSWATIGGYYGISRQGAQQRFS